MSEIMLINEEDIISTSPNDTPIVDGDDLLEDGL